MWTCTELAAHNSSVDRAFNRQNRQHITVDQSGRHAGVRPACLPVQTMMTVSNSCATLSLSLHTCPRFTSKVLDAANVKVRTQTPSTMRVRARMATAVNSSFPAPPSRRRATPLIPSHKTCHGFLASEHVHTAPQLHSHETF